MASESFFSKLAAFFGFKKSSGSSYPGRQGSSGSSIPKLYIGNLAYDVTDEDLRKAFAAHGRVSSASVVRDRFSNQSKGFGFVEMSNRSEAQSAMRALNGQDLKGRAINVNEARPRPEGSSGSGRGNFRRGRGNFRGRRGGSGGGNNNGGGNSGRSSQQHID